MDRFYWKTNWFKNQNDMKRNRTSQILVTIGFLTMSMGFPYKTAEEKTQLKSERKIYGGLISCSVRKTNIHLKP